MDAPDIVALSATLLGGQAIPPAVDALKDAGLPGRFGKLAAVFVGAGFGALAGVIASGDPTTMVALIATGGISGLMGSRNYDAAKTQGNLEGFDQAKGGASQPKP